MKKQLFFTALAFLFIVTSAGAQTSVSNPAVPGNSSGEKTFFEIQKSFYDYWAPYHVVDGYYMENGRKVKAAGWNQFKRWEYYWANRVDPVTGKFPAVTAADIYLDLKNQRGNRSQSGNWTGLGPDVSESNYYGIGRLNCVSFRSGDNDTYYTGSPSGGLWKTTDNGSSWTVLTDGNAVLGVSDIIVLAGTSPSTDTLYIATGDRDKGSMWTLGSGNYSDNYSIGVLKSTDGGSTWSTTGLSFSASEKKLVNRLLIDPDDHDILYAATSSGFKKSTDAGTTWTTTTANMYIDLEFKPGNSQVIYGASKVGTVFLSTDAGETWTKVLDDYNAGGRRTELAVSPDQPDWLYVLEASSSNKLFGVYRSTDSGNTFTMVYDGSVTGQNLLGLVTDGSGTTGQGWYDLALAASPSDANTLFLGGIITFKSTDHGGSWTAANCWTSSSTYNKNGAPVVHADKHTLKFREDDGVLFETNDGGIYYTSDGGGTWTDKTNGIVTSQMYRLSTSATEPSEVITGLQDNGTKLTSGGTWATKLGGDGMECIIDYVLNNTQYGCYQNGAVYRTTNHWTTATAITKNGSTPIHGLTETGYWVTPYIIDPNSNNTLYIGLYNIWKTTDQGDNWTKISNMTSSSKIRSLAIAPSNSQVIYAADPSHIWKTTDGGTSAWTDITGSLPVTSSSITYIAVKSDDPNTVWVSFGQYNTDGVYETTDGGTSWTNISSGLPSAPVMCVVQNKQNTAETELYAGTDVGVYLKQGSADWTSFSNGLPNVVVNELEIYYDEEKPDFSKLRAATSGRGLWESELYSPPNSPPAAEFSADIRIPVTGQTVTFTDESIRNPDTWSWSFSPATVTYVNSTGSSSQNPQVQFDATGLYEVTLTASNANGNDSETKTGYIRVADYCAASGLGTAYIDEVKLGSIDNTGTGDDHYTDYNYLSTKLTAGSSNTMTIGFGLTYTVDSLACWIDWNQDGDFEDSDELCFHIKTLYNSYQETITVPDTAKTGFTKMRLRLNYNHELSPCGVLNYGEVEDYAVEVIPATAIWKGTTSDWNNASNWSTASVPTASFNVYIPDAPVGGNFPVIPAGYTARCNKLVVNAGATLTVKGDLEVTKE